MPEKVGPSPVANPAETVALLVGLAPAQFGQKGGVLGGFGVVGHTVREGEVPVQSALTLVPVKVPLEATVSGASAHCTAPVGASDAWVVLGAPHTVREEATARHVTMKGSMDDRVLAQTPLLVLYVLLDELSCEAHLDYVLVLPLSRRHALEKGPLLLPLLVRSHHSVDELIVLGVTRGHSPEEYFFELPLEAFRFTDDLLESLLEARRSVAAALVLGKTFGFPLLALLACL